MQHSSNLSVMSRARAATSYQHEPAPVPRGVAGIINHDVSERDGSKRMLREACHLLWKIIALPRDGDKPCPVKGLPLPAIVAFALTWHFYSVHGA
ncbi:hypothetical protein B9G99_03270 [Kushneria konosiri]|uniref:Uncharacterized protein n=1 Tax=Kushneria konosiri TaxID=698828 RepID=A0A2Z2H432_9GAMM|nr:hypothetical protein B9G99_03270 [Kushneria konosiri]